MHVGDPKRFEQAQSDITFADLVFLSIPKSGRTWVRYFLQEYFSRVGNVSLTLAPRIMDGTDSSPSISFHSDFFEVFEHETAPTQMLFSREFSAKPLILLVRDPRDVVVSSYHYIRSRNPVEFSRHIPSGSMADFVHSDVYGVERLAKYQLLATEFFRTHRMPKLYLTYERLRAAPRGEFARVLAFLSRIPIDPDAFEAALASASISEMQNYEIAISREGRARQVLRLGVDNWSGDVNQLKVRRGVVGGFLDECSALDHLENFPFTGAALEGQLDPVAWSDTHWTVGTLSDPDDRHAPLLARHRFLAARIADLKERNEKLHSIIRGRDAIITKLKERLEIARSSMPRPRSSAVPR